MSLIRAKVDELFRTRATAVLGLNPSLRHALRGHMSIRLRSLFRARVALPGAAPSWKEL
jgi:hypothetical protein